MAGELQYSFSAGKTAYALIRNRIGQIWNTSGGTGTTTDDTTISLQDSAAA